MFGAGIAAYFGVLLFPVLMLCAVMLLDYISGMVNAYMTGTLSSRTGIKGIVKKLCYLMAVVCGMAVDYVISTALVSAGITFPEGTYIFGVLVTVWLIINETISILENLGKIGVPLPAFLKNISKRLKQSVEEKGDTLKKG